MPAGNEALLHFLLHLWANKAAQERSPLLIVARAERANGRVCPQLARPAWSCWKQAEDFYRGPDQTGI